MNANTTTVEPNTGTTEVDFSNPTEPDELDIELAAETAAIEQALKENALTEVRHPAQPAETSAVEVHPSEILAETAESTTEKPAEKKPVSPTTKRGHLKVHRVSKGEYATFDGAWTITEKDGKWTARHATDPVTLEDNKSLAEARDALLKLYPEQSSN